MLDRKRIREDTDTIRCMLADRAYAFDLDGFLALEQRERQLRGEIERHQAERNRVSQDVGGKKARGEDAAAQIETARVLNERLQALAAEHASLAADVEAQLLRIPNLPDGSVPKGPDESANVEIRRWGEPVRHAFSPKAHWDLAESLGMLDFSRAAKMTGARFVVYRGVGARLERALIQYMLDVNTREGGYLEIFPPLLVNRQSMVGTGQLPKLEEDMFRTRDEDLFLIPTAEVPVTNLHRDEILPAETLPRCYTAYTPCFRREAGSYGKDTKGIIRQHQFNKVEVVKITSPETSEAEHEKLVNDAEKILQRLGLPYRVMLLATGDLSFAGAKCYDLEVWHAGVGRFWEVSSCSNFTDFQARRANIRMRDAGGKPRFCHTLNGSALATSRLLPALLENGQQADGSVVLPEVLSPYLEGRRRIQPDGTLV